MKLLFSIILLLLGCVSIPSLNERIDQANIIAAEHGWQAISLQTNKFLLHGYEKKQTTKNEIITIYIEGDGYAWVNRNTISVNPTPKNPLALQLAIQSVTPAVYLARPCQFVDLEKEPNCNKKIWTHHRFSEEVITSMNQAINQIKDKYQAKHLMLVGYSGGGSIALLATLHRNDVRRVVTVAGNLDTRFWQEKHHLTPMVGSINPADFSQELSVIEQIHFVGGMDKNTGLEQAKSYLSKFPDKQKLKIVLMNEYDHECCWVENWNELQTTIFEKSVN